MTCRPDIPCPGSKRKCTYIGLAKDKILNTENKFIARIFFNFQRFFVPTSRQLKRLEAVTRSPIYNHFSETLSGASVIRAFGATNRFVRECLQRIDKNQVFYFAGITANRYLYP